MSPLLYPLIPLDIQTVRMGEKLKLITLVETTYDVDIKAEQNALRPRFEEYVADLRELIFGVRL